jgi:hypothetical protein
MSWMLRLYPARWRERYGEEFGAVLASQRPSVGLVLDVLAGAIDAHLHPQIQLSDSNHIKGDDKMTLEMLQRCAAGGPRLSPRDQRVASLSMILAALAMAVLYISLTKIYHAAPAVKAVFYASFPFLCLVYGQTAYLRRRPWLTQMFVLVAGLAALYLVMLTACMIGTKL